MSKAIEKARKELQSWETRAEALAQTISTKEAELSPLRESLGNAVLDGTPVETAAKSLEKAERELVVLKAGFQAANQKVTQARETVYRLEREDLEATVRANSTKADRLLVEILGMLESLADKETELANLAAETTRVKEAHDIRTSFGHYAPKPLIYFLDISRR